MDEQSEETAGLEKDRQEIKQAQQEGTVSTFFTYLKLAGPGWLQSAITIGGASLGGALFLGVIGGAELLWIQPLAVILGVCMLSAIAYVALSADKRPFDAMIEHVNPVLAWGWLVATILANVVWAAPQFGLATAALRKNLFPGTLGAEHMDKVPATLICVIPIAVVAIGLVWLYDTGLTGVKIFEGVIRAIVALVVVSFIGVVIKLSFAEDGIQWGKVLMGYIPDISLLWSPPDELLAEVRKVPEQYQAFWEEYIVSKQQDEIITAAAAAVGINMTFLMPYSMLKKGWDEDFRGLAVFDLFTGMLIPFLLVTSCIVIASMNRFHTQPVEGLLGDSKTKDVPVRLKKSFHSLALQRIEVQVEKEGSFKGVSESEFQKLKANGSSEELDSLVSKLSKDDQRMAAMLVNRDTFALANSLEPLLGEFISQYVFGIGVVGVAISTILIMMMINGFAISEALGFPNHGWVYKLSAAIPGLSFLAPLFWEGSMAYLVVPTSIFGAILLPIAYLSFWIMMNQKSLLGDDLPTGQTRLWINVVLGITTVLSGIASLYSLWKSQGWTGYYVLFGFIALAVIAHFMDPDYFKPAKQNS
jgi:Mn2+/Fe2+ NRAMP family transporter